MGIDQALVMSSPGLEPEILRHLGDVLHGLISLLNEYGETTRAQWLADRLTALGSDSTPRTTTTKAVQELHQVVLGMGGLMDMHLQSDDSEAAREANAALRRLADQVYELTR